MGVAWAITALLLTMVHAGQLIHVMILLGLLYLCLSTCFMSLRVVVLKEYLVPSHALQLLLVGR